MFQIFNPFTVSTVAFATVDEATYFAATLREQINREASMTPVFDVTQIMLADWYVAYQFYCAKFAQEPISFGEAGAFVASGANPLFNNHSVFNLTTNARWSRTFGYFANDKLFHIKVKDGVVTDWYQHQASCDGIEYEWVAFDLATGAPIEYYEKVGANLVKHDAATGEVIVQTNFIAGPDELPQAFKDSLTGFAHLPTVFAWAHKSYGDIVEFKESVENDATLITADVQPRYQSFIEQSKLLAQENAKLKLEQIVILQGVESNEDSGTVWWSAINAA